MKFKPQISRRGKHFFAEIALARGPRQMAVTGSGSFGELFGYAWMAILDRGERRLRLFQLQVAGTPWAIGTDPAAAEWVEVSVPALPHDTKELRHLALAFDQAARHVVAYERAGEVWVRQWDPGSGQYVMRGPWPGVDPVLINDVEVNFFVPDSDVLLFHLRGDRRSLIMRAQREEYAAEHAVSSLGAEAFLDQAIAASLRIQLAGSMADAPTETGLGARSQLYPLRPKVGLQLAGEWAGGDYSEIARAFTHGMGLIMAPAWAGGTYLDVLGKAYSTTQVTLAPAWAGGVYKEVVVKYGPTPARLALAPEWSGGVYAEIATAYTQEALRLSLSPSWAGGTYAPA